ncbi:hypothetical protein QAD02_019712 [Eretmocerus hayati]|uniref:Uncharacterized protein n=1 Tax=Eretmocerus hayati TaxID=131215 RepID=A0ACC2PK04_9HYME|nr:hypothetical protein QAD02_019712 [Eretmocerus hayati]
MTSPPRNIILKPKRLFEEDEKTEEKNLLRKQNSLIAFVIRATDRDQENLRLISRLRQALQETEDELILLKVEKETYEELVKLREEEIENLKKESKRLEELLNQQQEEKPTKIPQKRRRPSKTPSVNNDNEENPTTEVSYNSSPAKAMKVPSKPGRSSMARGLTRSKAVKANSEEKELGTPPASSATTNIPLDTIPEKEIPEKKMKVLKSSNSLPESAEPIVENKNSSTPSSMRSKSSASNLKSATPRKSLTRSETVSSPSTRIPISLIDTTKFKASNSIDGSPTATIGQRRSAVPKRQAAKKEKESSVQPALNVK